MALNASPFGWHDIDGTTGNEYTIARGNNVWTQEDADGNDGIGYSTDGGSSLIFDFPIDFEQLPDTYQDAAITNLFYWNNMLHDITYQYGFDEISGNFQENNYGKGGNENDCIYADAQDGGTTNNAYFSTPPDGSPGRMEMFRWTGGNSTHSFTINSPSSLAGEYFVETAHFGAHVGIWTADLVVVEDESATTSEACGNLVNTVNLQGKIALIDRGNCSFTKKVKSAQNAGAIAVLICNDVADPPTIMGGADDEIVIPTVMIGQADCASIRAEIPSVNATLSLGNAPRDGDLDNGIIVHEYGHGLSIRLTGGPSNSGCLDNKEQMGEGWSDWLALLLTTTSTHNGGDSRGIGTFAVDELITDNGIRNFPYSTNMAINPETYESIKNATIPHGVGAVWGNMLWEMTWGLIIQYGFDPDVYNGSGGNNIALQLVMDAMKLQNCSPGFVEGRDAILLADEINNNGANRCIIWKAFAKRGLGYSATQGSSDSVTDGTEAFDLPPFCQENLYIEQSVPERVATGNTLQYTITITNNKPTMVNNVLINSIIPNGTTYISGSASGGGLENGNNILFSAGNLASNTAKTYTFQVAIPDDPFTTILFEDDVETGSSNTNWSVLSGSGSDTWGINNNNPNSGAISWFVPNSPNENDQYLTSTMFTLGSQPLLSFHHTYDTEESKDGGMVEISTDAGLNWVDLEPYMLKNGYSGTLGASVNKNIENRKAFTGKSNGYVETWINLSSYSFQSVRLRFRFGSDDAQGAMGWYVDDIKILNAVYINGEACATSSNGDSACATSTTLVEENKTASVQLKAFLQGAYLDNQIMSNVLNTNNLLPNNHPYLAAPWQSTATVNTVNFATFPNNIVDYVLVEARNATDNSQILDSKIAYILQDGTVTDFEKNSESVTFNNIENGEYYLALRHRNHLDIMSSQSVILPDFYDFTIAENVLSQTVVEVDNGVFALYAGDINGDGIINVADYNQYTEALDNTSIQVYHKSDCNLDGDLTISDFNHYQPNASVIGVRGVRY